MSMTSFYLIIQFRSVCLKFSKPPCCFEIFLHQDSSISACYLVTLFQKVWYEYVMVQYRRKSNLIIKNMVKQKPLSLQLIIREDSHIDFCATIVNLMFGGGGGLWTWRLKNNENYRHEKSFNPSHAKGGGRTNPPPSRFSWITFVRTKYLKRNFS